VTTATEASYYKTEGAACRCLLCPHACLVANGKTGRCRARAAEGGVLYATGYGAAASLALDPIEKKPLYRFHPGSSILSYGSYGCNMGCAWCQNSSISQCPPPPDAPRLTPEELTRHARAAATGTQAYPHGNVGVAFTYNEPLVSPEFILDAAPLLHAAGLAVVLVTNAMIHEAPFADILKHTDAMNIDLKGFSEGVYERNGGSLNSVKRNIEAAAKSPGCHIEVTTLIVPGENDAQEGIRAEAEWLASIDAGIPLHITRFFPRYRSKAKEPTPIKTIESLAGIARGYLRYVYAGNIFYAGFPETK
jgi:pyruvate formate lyase activating enzyme